MPKKFSFHFFVVVYAIDLFNKKQLRSLLLKTINFEKPTKNHFRKMISRQLKMAYQELLFPRISWKGIFRGLTRKGLDGLTIVHGCFWGWKMVTKRYVFSIKAWRPWNESADHETTSRSVGRSSTSRIVCFLSLSLVLQNVGGYKSFLYLG